MKKLEQAFLIFQESLIEVIDAEAKRRAEALVADKEKEMVALKAKYEKELIRHQEILLAAQNSSMVGVLKKKWLGI